MTRALDLSEEFFNDVALPALRDAFPDAWGRMGAGLVGNGSECMGYDDELSRDHDWGIEFLIWLTDEDFDTIGDDVRRWKAALWEAHPEQPFRVFSDYGVKNTVLTPGLFYTSLIGSPRGPQTVLEWRRPPEANLALAVDGRVFTDPVGEFSATREYLLGYYPEPLRLKKIAARCMSLAQTGQYNFLRIAQRGDIVAREIALAKFVQDAISMTFLLNRVFMPYYKWAFRAMRDLPVLASDIAPLLEILYAGGRIDGKLDPGNVLLRPVDDDVRDRAVIVEAICAHIVDELRRQGLTDADATFLAPHGESVQSRVDDPDLSRLPAQYE